MKTKTEIETLEILPVVRPGAGPVAREKSQGFLFNGRKAGKEKAYEEDRFTRC